MLLWTITRYGHFNCQHFFLKSATQELIEVLPDPKEKTLLPEFHLQFGDKIGAYLTTLHPLCNSELLLHMYRKAVHFVLGILG